MTASRIGLLGGTFDPVHTGHLQMAEAAIRECRLDQLLFIPSASPPHKAGTPITPFFHRRAMLELACMQNPQFSCSGIEGHLPFPSYTIDTLHALGDMYPPGTVFYFVIGVDAFLDFTTWKSYRDILRLVHIVVAIRHGYSHEELTRFLQSIGYFWHDNSWRKKNDGPEIFLLQTVPGDFSSTLIRKKMRQGDLPTAEIPPEILEYIVKNQLYQTGPQNGPHPSDPR